jgi:hypothetical protein
MVDDKKSTDPGLSAAERKTLRNREAREAIADLEEVQRAVHGNLERLREERLAREAAAGPMLYPALELPDDTPIENVRFSTRIRNALITAGFIRRDVVKPPGSRKGVCRSSSGDVGPSLNRWGQALGQKAHVICGDCKALTPIVPHLSSSG